MPHTAQFEDFNNHYLLSCPRYMYLNLPKTVHPNRPNTTDSPKHCIDDSDRADFIHLSDRFLNNRCWIKLVSWGPWVPRVYSTCILTAFCFELPSSSEDKTCMLHTCYYNSLINFLPFKIRWVPQKRWGCTALFPFLTSAEIKMIHPSAGGYAHHHHQIGLIQHNHSVLGKV